MRNQLDEFVLRYPIFQRTWEMKAELLGAIQGNQCRDGDQAAVALGEARPFPYIAEQNLLGKFRKLGRKVGERPLLAGCGGCESIDSSWKLESSDLPDTTCALRFQQKPGA